MGGAIVIGFENARTGGGCGHGGGNFCFMFYVGMIYANFFTKNY